jgi:hypothetical protein
MSAREKISPTTCEDPVHYSRPSDFEHFVLKEDAQAVAIDTGEACRLAALSMARQATRSIDIVSRQLDPQMYDNREFCEAVSQLITGSRRARVQALIRHTDPVVKHGHRLVTLSQRFSSFIEMRVPAAEFNDYNAAFLIVDGTGVIYRTLSDGFEATVNFNDPRMARELSQQFEAMWQTALPDANLRRSHL